VILGEIEKVHLESLIQLRSDDSQALTNEAHFQSLVHKVKGGAQLLQATQFIHTCQELEQEGPLIERIADFIKLLEEQNGIIETYQKRYRQ
jgi:two-component system sensor histidine kinase EvgS